MRTDVDNNVYSVIISPLKNLELLNFYIAHSFTLSTALIFLISCFILYKKYLKEVFVITILGLSASAPMTLLLNREWSIYSFYSMIIFVSLIQLSAIKIRDLDNQYIKLLISISFIILTLFHAYTPSMETNWDKTQQNYNKNVLQAVNNIKNNIIGKKVLFVGLEGPYHPFKSMKFIEEYASYKITNFDVLLYENEKAWNEMSEKDQPNGIYEKDLNLTMYDDVIMFNAHGRISNIYLPAQLNVLKHSELNKKLFLNCNFLPTQANIQAVDEKKLLQLMECLNSKLKFQSTTKIIENKYFDINITNPWGFYHLAKAYNNLGNQDEAISIVDRAIKIEPKNQTFENLKLEIYKEKGLNQ
jgi:tetratricopeptide (TPR) repeat protein